MNIVPIEQLNGAVRYINNGLYCPLSYIFVVTLVGEIILIAKDDTLINRVKSINKRYLPILGIGMSWNLFIESY